MTSLIFSSSVINLCGSGGDGGGGGGVCVCACARARVRVYYACALFLFPRQFSVLIKIKNPRGDCRPPGPASLIQIHQDRLMYLGTPRGDCQPSGPTSLTHPNPPGSSDVFRRVCHLFDHGFSIFWLAWPPRPCFPWILCGLEECRPSLRLWDSTTTLGKNIY